MRHLFAKAQRSRRSASDRPTAPQRALLAAPFLALFATALITLSSATAQAQAADLAGATSITFGAATTIVGEGASADGDHVTITAAGTYVVAGSTSDGSVTVDSAGSDVTLVLDGATITNPEGPAIFFENAASAAVTLAAGSTNVITDGGESEYDAALYSDTTLTIDGDGSLEVHAVYEGISSTMHINIAGGTLRIFANEDAINANEDGVSQINISGGYIFIATETGDGIDSNGTITITGGTVITQSALVGGNSGLDADGAITIDGGLVIATGGTMMGAIDSGSAQETIVVNYGTTQAADTLIVVRDAAGTQLLAFAPSLPYQQFLLNADALADGVTYTVYAGGVASGAAVDGLYDGVVLALGTEVTSVTTASGQSGGGFGGRGGMPGGQPGGPGFPGGQQRQ